MTEVSGVTRLPELPLYSGLRLIIASELSAAAATVVVLTNSRFTITLLCCAPVDDDIDAGGCFVLLLFVSSPCVEEAPCVAHLFSRFSL